MDLVTIGHLHQAHPTFASATCLREEIMSLIYSKIATMSEEDKTLLKIPANCKLPNVYVSTGKTIGTYLNNTISSTVFTSKLNVAKSHFSAHASYIKQ
jgi:hypothetical protein